MLSKRHQARNERALQELIKAVPGNDRCADCGAKNPGMCCWSLYDCNDMLISICRMGQLECMESQSSKTSKRLSKDQSLTVVSQSARHISVYAMRLTPPQARDTHFEGQITEHGQLVQRSS